MTYRDLTLEFAQCLLGLEEDSKGFRKYRARLKRDYNNSRTQIWRDKNRARVRRINQKAEQVRTITGTHTAWRQANLTKIRAMQRRGLVAARRWKAAHPANVAAIMKRASLKRMQDPSYRIANAARMRVYGALKQIGTRKTRHTLDLLGVQNAEEVWAHLEKQFKPGMTRDNYGTAWEIDHIKPCASFDLTDPAQQKACFHYTNLQPLTPFENRSKGARVA